MAGYGMNHMALLGCPINGWYEPGGAKIAFKMVPVEIINGVGGAPDQIRLAFGNSDLFMAPAKFTATANTSQANYKIDNKFGFNEGDLVVAAEAGKPCTLAQVSTKPSSDNVIVHNSGNYTSPEGGQVPTQFNRPGGLPAPEGQSYKEWDQVANTGARLYNLGAAPTVVTYAIQNNQLVAINELTPGAAGQVFALADGVVQLQAHYGYDGNGDGQIRSDAPVVANVSIGGTTDQWADNMPAAATGADWARVIAIRLVVTSRSMTPEKPNPATGVCDTTTQLPKWFANDPVFAIDVDIKLADPANWQCYRYRTFEVTVPLRNMVWFPQNA
jgi:type IV pilus assembly protein PilW